MRSGLIKQYQIRYRAYAAAHGCTPDKMQMYDAEAYPGGRMTGFVRWVTAAWLEWAQEAGESVAPGMRCERQHVAFNRWLTARYLAGTEEEHDG